MPCVWSTIHSFGPVQITSPNPRNGDYDVIGCRSCVYCEYVQNVYKQVFDGDFDDSLWTPCDQAKINRVLVDLE